MPEPETNHWYYFDLHSFLPPAYSFSETVWCVQSQFLFNILKFYASINLERKSGKQTYYAAL